MEKLVSVVDMVGRRQATVFRGFDMPLMKVGEVGRNLIPNVREGDVLILTKIDLDDEEAMSGSGTWRRRKSKKFTVVKFYEHHALLRSEFGYMTSVSYLDLKSKYKKRGTAGAYE